MSLFPCGCVLLNLFNFMKLDVINKTALETVIFKLLFLSYMPTTLSFSFYHANSIAMLYIVHNYKKKFESTNMI